MFLCCCGSCWVEKKTKVTTQKFLAQKDCSSRNVKLYIRALAFSLRIWLCCIFQLVVNKFICGNLNSAQKKNIEHHNNPKQKNPNEMENLETWQIIWTKFISILLKQIIQVRSTRNIKNFYRSRKFFCWKYCF